MTRTELNTLIDTTITNKTAPNSITPQNEGDALKAVADYVDQEIEAIELLPGTQGPAGPQGVPGPVGPAGLNWQGQWTSGASYVEDDAVGYNGASWFCINATSGTTTPNLDVSSWALLASQGATGPQGPQGPSGTSSASTYSENLTAGSSFPYPQVTTNFALVNSTGLNQRVSLPPNKPLGTEIRIGNISSNSIIINAGFGYSMYLSGIGSELGFNTEIILPPGEEFTFIYITNNVWSAYKRTVPYKSYVAEIALDSSPITIPLQNDLDSVITVTRSSTVIVITASDPVFTINKTHIMCSSYNLGGITYTMHPIRFSDTQIYLQSFKGDGTSAIGYGTSIFVEIKVFN